jgi:hypothetical protein
MKKTEPGMQSNKNPARTIIRFFCSVVSHVLINDVMKIKNAENRKPPIARIATIL